MDFLHNNVVRSDEVRWNHPGGAFRPVAIPAVDQQHPLE